MILIDSVFVNVGGTKVLLEYLLSNLKNNSEEYFLLLDYRTQSNLNVDLECFNHQFIKGYFARKKFYKDNGNKFSKILCFGNLPPNYKFENTKVFTYFHQQLYLDIPKEFSIIRKFIYYLKVNILRSLIINCDQWFVQSSLIAKKLSDKFNINNSDIKILPFYPPLQGDVLYERIKNTFIYVSDATPHKNHYRLIEAFCAFYDKKNMGSLTLTIPDKAVNLIDFIQNKIRIGYPINNIGFVQRDSLYEQYMTHEYLIFPSLAESFGLGLVEGIECGCKIIAADLPYTYQVCSPSLVFNPLDEKSIQDAFLKTQSSVDIPYSRKKVVNGIDSIITILEN